MTRVIDMVARCAGALTVAGLLAACGSGGKPGQVVTVTVPPSAPATSSAATSSGSASASQSATAPATARTKLGGTCDSLLPDYLVTQELGGTPLAGQDAFVVGVPDSAIGRLTTINCRYGVAGKPPTPKAEIGISLYSTPAQAAARITATIEDYVAHGATSAVTTVSGVQGTQLTGGSGEGYDVPLLVLATDQRTVAVGIATDAAKDPTGAAVKLAALALKRTAA